METKSAKVTRLVRSGNWKDALNILRYFRLEFTKEQKRAIEITSDVLNGHGSFYRQLGIDTEQVSNDCKAMLTEKYSKNLEI